MKLRVNAILKGSRANGPGKRAVLWVQGCLRNCPGCFNPGTHDPGAGQWMGTTEAAEILTSEENDGVTISGGEPFDQPEALSELLRLLRQKGVSSILVFTGYSYETIQNLPCLKAIDALICGPFRSELPPDYDRLCSSANQQLILLTNRFMAEDFKNLPLAEWITDENGNLTRSGILRKELSAD